MSRSQVLLFRDFAEDQRTSMEIYADNLYAGLCRLKQQQFEFVEYLPHLASLTRRLTERANLRMRCARYLDYPLQARKQTGDLYHILDHGYAHLMKVLDPACTIVTVHDIIPILAGRGLITGVRTSRRSWLAEWTARFYRKAVHIIAISESTKRDLVHHCGCRADRISVIYWGLGEGYGPGNENDRQSIRAELGLPVEGRLLLITAGAFYKNQVTSLKVVERLWCRHPEKLYLVRLGRTTDEWRRLRATCSKPDRIVEIEYLLHNNMPKLYKAIDCLLFPSWYEGFGWPPVEAMACGTPAVTSNVASLPEAVGDGGLTASPDDVEGLSKLVGRLLEDDNFRQRQIERGLVQATRFRWEDTVRQVLEVYRQVLAGKKTGY